MLVLPNYAITIDKGLLQSPLHQDMNSNEKAKSVRTSNISGGERTFRSRQNEVKSSYPNVSLDIVCSSVRRSQFLQVPYKNGRNTRLNSNASF